MARFTAAGLGGTSFGAAGSAAAGGCARESLGCDASARGAPLAVRDGVKPCSITGLDAGVTGADGSPIDRAEVPALLVCAGVAVKSSESIAASISSILLDNPGAAGTAGFAGGSGAGVLATAGFAPEGVAAVVLGEGSPFLLKIENATVICVS